MPSIDIFNPVHTGVPAGLLDDPENVFSFDFVEDWYGFYLQDQVELPYDLHLLAGFRYDNAGTSETFTQIIPGPPTPFESSRREDAVTPRFGLLWRPLPELSLFGSYVENFGASNGRTVDGSLLPHQTAQQWEAGIKTELLDGRLTGSLAWFDLTQQNLPRAHPDPVLAAQGFSVAVGEVRHQGLELDLSGELSPGLKAIASFAYIDSEITIDRGLDFDNLDANGNPTITDGNTGHRLDNVPRFGGSLWTTYEFQGGDLQGLKLGAGMVARGQREGNQENDFQLPGYATVNLLAGYEWKVGLSKVSLQLNIDNLLDKSFFESTLGTRFLVSPGAPRTFLGSVRVEF